MAAKAITKEEAREQFLSYVAGIVDYWDNDKNFMSGPKTTKEKMEGLIFSLFATFDGASVELPAFDLVTKPPGFQMVLRPHPKDEAYCKKEKIDWFVDGMAINDDCQLHELWCQYRHAAREEKSKQKE